MQLVSHQPFTSRQDAIENEKDIVSTRRIVDKELERKTVRQTDVGKRLTQQVIDLQQLLRAYKSGEIVEDTLQRQIVARNRCNRPPELLR